MKVDDWISVNDSLPPIGKEVQVYCPNKIPKGRNPVTALARFIRHEGFDSPYYWDNFYGGSNYTKPDSVTHWKPMSCPPDTKEPSSQWISVDDHTPENQEGKWSKDVIALSDTGDVFRLACMGGYWQRPQAFIDSGATKVTHWMPLIYPDD